MEQLLAEVDDLDFSDRRDAVGTGAFEHGNAVHIDELAEEDVARLHSFGRAAFHDESFFTREEVACVKATTPITPQDFVKLKGALRQLSR